MIGVFSVVLDGGAVGNGADDTAAMLMAVQSGAPIIAIERDIVSGLVELPSHLCIVGPGKITKKVSSEPLFYALGQSDIRIEVPIDGNGQNQTGNHADVWFEDCEAVEFYSRLTNGNGTATSLYGAVTFKNCTDCKVDARVIGARYDGLFLYGGGRHQVMGFYDSNGYSGVATLLSNDVTLTVHADGNGASNITLNGLRNRAIGCTGTNSVSNHGINLGHDVAGQDASGSEVMGGNFSGNAMSGVSILGGSNQVQKHIRVAGALCDGNTDGIKTAGAERCTITGNTLLANTLDGLRLEGNYNLAEQNQIHDNSRYGVHIYLAASTGNRVARNKLSGNWGAIVDNGTDTELT